jgi:hypothetical protein
MRDNLRNRLGSLFRRRPPPESEKVELDPDPEWDELLAWAEVTERRPGPGPSMEEGGDMRGEEQEWAERIESAQKRLGREVGSEASAWAAAIARAKAVAEESDQAEWAAAIARAKVGASQGAAAVSRLLAQGERREGGAGAGNGWKKGLDREEAQWQAAIRRAKGGHG